MYLKKKTIFRMFIIPLVIVMLIQSLIAYGTVFLSRTTNILDNYAINMMQQTIENRKIILENDMVQRWSNVTEGVTYANMAVAQILKEKQMDINEFMSDKDIQSEFLDDVMSECLYMLRKNEVNGAFIILANNDTEAGVSKSRGLYFRDADPYINSGDYSDVLLERGDRNFSHKSSIPFDTFWTSEFRFEGEGEREADNFFYIPYRAALNNPGASVNNLMYWSSPFCLEDNTTMDSYRMISCSVPLIYDDGTVYGVLGVEISCKALMDMMPAGELNSSGDSGYLLIQSTEDGEWKPMVSSGVLAEHLSHSDDTLYAGETTYEDIYKLTQDEKIYASASPLHLYNSNTPFVNEQWMVVGLQTENDLLGIGKRITVNVILAILIAFIFGVICIYLVVRHVTHPIRCLTECIRRSSSNKLEGYQSGNIEELDELYGVVSDLTQQQELSQAALSEERERYRIALQSSRDMFFTYDINEQFLDMFNLHPKSGEIGEFRRKVTEEKFLYDFVHDKDRERIVHLAATPPDEIKEEIRLRNSETGEFKWMELSGKVIYDSTGKKSKVIGSVKNINEQKLKELNEIEAARYDTVTGLYHKEEGRKKIVKQMEKYSGGCFLLIDFENFRELNERYGMVLGDMILEEIGRLINSFKVWEMENKKSPVLPVRLGGHEILICLPMTEKSEAFQFAEELLRRITDAFQGAGFELAFSTGISCYADKEQDYEKLLGMAYSALAYAKKNMGKKVFFYDEIPESDAVSAASVIISDIASAAYTEKLNIVSATLNLFDKGGDVNSVLSVLFVKLGYYYQADAIVISLADRDFHTTYAAWQWHNDYKNGKIYPETEGVHRFSAKEFGSLVSWVEKDSRYFNDEMPINKQQRYFLMLSGKDRGMSLPIYDNGLYSGSVTFIGREDAAFWKKEEKTNLSEVVKIIENNINRERYDQASQAKTEFLSRMSHEIRTPMNAIIGMTEIAMHEEKSPDKVHDCLAKISNSSAYLLSLINDILDMSKIESGKMRLALADFSLLSCVDSVTNLVQPQMQAKQIEFEKDILLTDEWVVGDELHLNQILINLLGNAVKFTEIGGRIQLCIHQKKLSDTETSVYISVKDNGIGIKPENADRIFNSFEQADVSTLKHYGGTGLGLAISNKLVQMMDGDISLRSEEGKGSDFFFTIHLKTGNKNQKDTTGTSPDHFFDGKRILLVEDNLLNAEIAKTLLEMNGFLVEQAENGKKAVEAFQGHPVNYYDAVLMDIRMPVMDGLTATKYIRQLQREDAKSIPIIAMTANAFDDDMKKSIESGMDGHLTKPVDVDKLLKMLAAALSDSKR